MSKKTRKPLIFGILLFLISLAACTQVGTESLNALTPSTTSEKSDKLGQPEILLQQIRTEIHVKCPTLTKETLEEYLQAGCISKVLWKRWKIYLHRLKATPSYYMYAKLLIGKKTLRALKSTFASRLHIHTREEFTRIFGEEIVGKLRKLRAKSEFKGLIGLVRLCKLTGPGTVVFMLNKKIISAGPLEKKAYLRWRNRLRWQKLRALVGISNIKTQSDWRDVKGSHLLWSLRHVRPFNKFFNKKLQDDACKELVIKHFLHAPIQSYDSRIEAIKKAWKDLFEDGKYNTNAANDLWGLLFSLGRNFKGHKILAKIAKIRRLDPMEFFHMRISLFEYPRSKMRKYWRLIWLVGGVFTKRFLKRTREYLKNDKKFLAFIRKLRPFSGYTFNSRFRALARLYHKSRFAFDILQSSKFVTDRRLEKCKAVFVKQYGAEGEKLYASFVKTFIKTCPKGFKSLKNARHLKYLVGFFAKHLGGFSSLRKLEEKLEKKFGRRIGHEIMMVTKGTWLKKVEFGWRFSKRIRVAMKFYESTKLKFIRMLLKGYGRRFSTKDLREFVRKLQKHFPKPALKALIRRFILRYIRRVKRQGFSISNTLTHSIETAVKLAEVVKKYGLSWDQKEATLANAQLVHLLGSETSQRIRQRYFDNTKAFIVKKEEELTGLERFGTKSKARPSHFWGAMPESVKKFIKRRNYRVTPNDIAYVKTSLVRTEGEQKAGQLFKLFQKTLLPGGNVQTLNEKGRRDIIYGKCMEPLVPGINGKRIAFGKKYITPGAVDDVKACLTRYMGPEIVKKFVPAIKKRLHTSYSFIVYEHVFERVQKENKLFSTVVKKELSKAGGAMNAEDFFGIYKRLNSQFGSFVGLNLFLRLIPAFKRSHSGYRLIYSPESLVELSKVLKTTNVKKMFSEAELKDVEKRFDDAKKLFSGPWAAFMTKYMTEKLIYETAGKNSSAFTSQGLLKRHDEYIRREGPVQGEKSFKKFHATLTVNKYWLLNTRGRKLVRLYNTLKLVLKTDDAIKKTRSFKSEQFHQIADQLTKKYGYQKGSHRYFLFRRAFTKVFTMTLNQKRLDREVTAQHAREAVDKLYKKYSKPILKKDLAKILPKLQATAKITKVTTSAGKVTKQEAKKETKAAAKKVETPAKKAAEKKVEVKKAEIKKTAATTTPLKLAKEDKKKKTQKLFEEIMGKHMKKIHRYKVKKSKRPQVIEALQKVSGFPRLLEINNGYLSKRNLRKIKELAAENYEDHENRLNVLNEALVEVEAYKLNDAAIMKVLKQKPEVRELLELHREKFKKRRETAMKEEIKGHLTEKLGHFNGDDYYFKHNKVIDEVISSLAEMDTEDHFNKEAKRAGKYYENDRENDEDEKVVMLLQENSGTRPSDSSFDMYQEDF